jgi:hypothetical protein
LREIILQAAPIAGQSAIPKETSTLKAPLPALR